jgi:hypothetical protein
MALRACSFFGLMATVIFLGGCGGSDQETPNPSVASFTFPTGKGGTLTSPGFDVVEANKFKVTGTKNIQITALGAEVIMPTQESKLVAIFDATAGTILASAIVSTADTVNFGYFYKAISPVTLSAGKTYFIGALHHAGGAGTYLHNTNVASTPAYIEDQGTYFKVTSDIATGTWESGGSVRHYMAAFESRLASH